MFGPTNFPCPRRGSSLGSLAQKASALTTRLPCVAVYAEIFRMKRNGAGGGRERECRTEVPGSVLGRDADCSGLDQVTIPQHLRLWPRLPSAPILLMFSELPIFIPPAFMPTGI